MGILNFHSRRLRAVLMLCLLGLGSTQGQPSRGLELFMDWDVASWWRMRGVRHCSGAVGWGVATAAIQAFAAASR